MRAKLEGLGNVRGNDFWQLKRQERQRDRAAIGEFVAASCAGDAERFAASIDLIEHTCFGWRRAMRAMVGKSCPKEFRRRFLGVWLKGGDHIRGEVDNDLVLIDALRAMLPRYTGKDKTLYRGDSAFNRKLRTYGLSWTAAREVGRGFASGLWQTFEGGSVLLQARVPKEAIICAPAHIDSRFTEEREYLVDRRLVPRVDVIERFPQRDLETEDAFIVAEWPAESSPGS
jgi:hypothetical protein